MWPRECEAGVMKYCSCTDCAHRPILLRLSPPCEGGVGGVVLAQPGIWLRAPSFLESATPIRSPEAYDPPPLPPLRKGGKGMVDALGTIVRNKSRPFGSSRMTRSTPTFLHPRHALPESS